MVQTTGRSGNANLAADRVGHGGQHGGEPTRQVAHLVAARGAMWWPYQSAVVPASAVMMASSGSCSLSAWNTRRGLTGSASVVRHPVEHVASHVRMLLGDALLPGPVLGPGQEREQRGEGGLGVTPEVDLHRVAQAQVAGRAGRSARPGPVRWGAGTRRRGSSCRPSAACRSPASCRSWAWTRAGRAAGCGTGTSPGTAPLPSSAVMMPAPSRSATARTSSVAPSAPWPTSIATFVPALSTAAACSSARRRRRDRGRGVADTGAGHEVRDVGSSMSRSCTSAGRMTTVGWRYGPGDADGPVDDQLGLHRGRDRLDVLGHVAEEALHVELLLEVAAHRHPGLLADDRHDRLVVAVGVVEAVHHVDRTRSGGRDADADLAGELGVGARPSASTSPRGWAGCSGSPSRPARRARGRRRSRRCRRRGTRRTGAGPTRSDGR